MAIATEPASAPVTPMHEFDDETMLVDFTTKAGIAGAVAWDLLTHLQGFGNDLTRVDKLPLPEGAESEDMTDFLYSLVTEAGEIGYRVAQIDVSGFDLPWDSGRLRTSDLARAIAGLMNRRIVETEEAFDPDWLAKLPRRITAEEAAATAGTVAA
jgi:hypothetical protein